MIIEYDYIPIMSRKLRGWLLEIRSFVTPAQSRGLLVMNFYRPRVKPGVTRKDTL
jgi:hypothetical protein